jgi:capsular exopolysaccharide synthesis family protein
MIGTIPDSKALALPSNGRELPSDRSKNALPVPEAEAFRMLRARLRYFNVDREIRSVAITSAAPGDGKSTVAYHLAATAASAGSRTLLLEADLHQNVVARNLSLSPIPGLSEVLTGQSTLEEAVQEVEVGDKSNGGLSTRRLGVIVAGASPPNSGELMESDEFAELIDRLSAQNDLVVIDTPPATIMADAIPIMKIVGGVIVIGGVGKTTRDDAIELRDQLQSLGVTTLGVVANRVNAKRSGYGNYYRSPVGQ